MRSSSVLFAFLIVFCCSIGPRSARAQTPGKNGVGVGIIVGDKTGFSLKKWLSEKSAADFAIGWSVSEPQFLFVHADYLYHFDLVEPGKGQLPFYLGIGGLITFASDLELGIRIPLGVEYIFEDAPLGLFLEIVPRMNLTPATVLKIGGGGGIRFYF